MILHTKIYGLAMIAVLLTTLVFSTPASTAPPPPDRPERSAISVGSMPSGTMRAPDTDAPTSQTVDAADVVVQANGIYTWTQATASDWAEGTPENLDSATISGSLQLEPRWFTENTTVTPRDQLASGQISPDVVADAAGNLYAVWVDRRETNSDLYFAQRPQGGAWSTNVRVNDVPGSVSDNKTWIWGDDQPALALDDAGNLYAVWIDERNGRKDVYFAMRPSGGSWSTNERVNDDTYREIACERPDVVVTGAGTVHVVWTDMRRGDRNVYHAIRSPDFMWSTNVRINDDAGRASQYWARVDIDANGILYAVWGDYRNGDSDIYFAQRSSNGDWEQNERISDDATGTTQYAPEIAVTADGKAYVVWEDYRNGSGSDKSDIYFSERLSDGTWSTNVRVNQTTTGYQEQPNIAVDGLGDIHVFWKDLYSSWWSGERSEGTDLYHAERSAGSSTWSAAKLVNDRQCWTYCFGYVSQRLYKGYAVAADDAGYVYALWTDGRHDSWDIYFNHRPPSGSWQINTRVNDDGEVNQGNPSLVGDATGNLDVIWDTWSGWPSVSSIFHAERPTNNDWTTIGDVNDDVDADQSAPDLAADADGTLHAVWVDERDDPAQVYYAQRPSGDTWQADERVSDVEANAISLTGIGIAVDDIGNTYVLWQDGRNTDDYGDIYFAKRDAATGTWSADVKVNDDAGTETQFAPDIAVDGDGNAYAVWQDNRNTDDYGDIYFAERDATTGVWSANVKINDDTGTTTQSAPKLSVDESGHVYVVWEDQRDGSAQIYFTHRPAGGTWSANVRVSPDDSVRFPTFTSDADAKEPAIVTDDIGQVYVAWSSGVNMMSQWLADVHLAIRSPEGTWTPARQVNDSWEAINYGVSLAVDAAGKVSLVWEDGRHGAPNLYFAQSLDAPVYVPQGTYTSPELDTGVIAAAWDTLAYSATLPAGTSLTFETRSRQAGGTWSAWAPVESGEIASPPAQFLQYRAVFSSTSESISPLLDWVKIMYRSTGTPSAPRFVTPEGVTNQTNPPVRGVAAAGSVVHIFVDGTEVSTATVDADGFFSVAPDLTAGAHTLSAQAKNTAGQGPPSDALELTVDPDLPYDPVAVRAGEWSKDGWLLAPPRDSEGAANPQQGWRIWPRADKKFRVEMPVTYTTSAAVTVTVGTQTITLTEEAGGYFVGIVQPPIQEGDFVIKTDVDGKVTTIDGGPVLIEPDGLIYAATGTISDTLSGVEVTCYYSDTHAGQWVKWEAWHYDQVNPQTTLDDGYYTFYSPAGTYRVVAEKEGYPIYTSPDLVVVDTPVRHNIPLGDFKIYLPLVMRQ